MLILQKAGHRDLERYYPLFETDFDSEELLGKLAVHRGMMNGSVDFLTLHDEESGMDAGYALVLTKNLYGYVDLKYFAVMPWFRGRGFGIQLMREINRRYADSQGSIAGVRDNLYVKTLKSDADLTPVIHRVLPDFYTRFMPASAVWRMLDIRPAAKE